MQNFSSTVAIVSALNNPAVRRLKRTWEQVGSRSATQFRSCEVIMDPDHNFHTYWSALKDATPPAIPFFGKQPPHYISPSSETYYRAKVDTFLPWLS